MPERALVRLRRHAFAKRSQFIDPYVIAECGRVLDRRGEVWAASVLGRDLTARSVAVPARPYLRGGEEYVLVAADRAEDELVLEDASAS
ncbi:hypothetical protein [Mycolicibacterium sphagni]|uniref:hypothetical protein n=1 Tax=Mycolicibacterium sphagni TaxID=1786 RepID=UPI0021F39797|nr:hypothetical protein [Mycolicibacterium sphagni]